MSDGKGTTSMVQGRIVWVSGNLFTGKMKTIFGTQDPKLNKAGEPMKEYGFGLAVPKSALQHMGEGQPGHVWAAIHAEAQGLYPGGQIPPGFAMKYKDGDTVDDKGQPYANRAGYADHIVLSCTTSLPIKYFRYENGANIMINEGIKCGDYVNVQLQIKAHGAIGQGKPGLYLNPNAVQFLGFGEEIVNTPSGDQLFGTAAPAMPAGATAMPTAPTGQIMPTAQPAMPAAPQPMAPATPNYAVVPQQFAPAPAPGVAALPVQPAMPAAPVMNAAEPIPQQFAQPVQPAVPAPVQQPAMPAGFPPVPGM